MRTLRVALLTALLALRAAPALAHHAPHAAHAGTDPDTPVPVAAAVATETPRLVVVITVDQLRGDYPDRFAANLTGGLDRFRTEGTFYPHGRQDHALTATAPGHATVLSGRVPAHTNILTNDHGVPDDGRPLIAGARGTGASPKRFRGTTLYDWMLAVEPGTRALSVSRKDRGAILPIGVARTHVYWWGHDRFTTSTYYRDTLPSWVAALNTEIARSEWEGKTWTLLLPEAAYPEPDDQPFEGVGAGRPYLFPHRMGSILEVPDFPWSDSLTIELALRGARELGLGQSDRTDLLAVSLSALDAIGHDFGPDSREVHDHVLRVDRWLAWFMREIEALVGASRIVYALTSDHGVSSMPQFVEVAGRAAGRIDLSVALTPALVPLQQQYAYRFGLELQSGVLLADTVGFRARGVDVDALGAELAARMAELPGVARTFTPASLAAASDEDEDARLWRRSIPRSHDWLVLAQPQDGWVFTGSGKAEHGTPLSSNMVVPIAFLGPGIPALRVDGPARTIDIGPTLAAILGVQPTEDLDGIVLGDVVPHTHAAQAQ
jgi:hypothetical protein